MYVKLISEESAGIQELCTKKISLLGLTFSEKNWLHVLRERVFSITLYESSI